MNKKYFIINDIDLLPGEPEDKILSIIKEKYSINVLSWQIYKKSIDARKKKRVIIKYRILIETSDSIDLRDSNYKKFEIFTPESKVFLEKRLTGKNFIVVGAGPAGLFSALRLIEYGANVLILERGKDVDSRMKDISLLEKEGLLNLESNVLFGEGGAGTYSDGKLTTRINKSGINWFYEKLLENGGNSSLRYESKPHVGTDKLMKIIKNIRTKITESGSEIKFSKKVTSLIVNKESASGVRVEDGEEFFGDSVIWATGHSARDSFQMLYDNGISLEKKGFAVGARIEHPAEFINTSQYGKPYKDLPAAEYKLAYNNKVSGRGVYSFCMCPGGMIVNSSSENEKLCVNGMSYSARDSRYSNSAIVVSVFPEDIEGDVLNSILFQRDIESKCFSEGGGGFTAPAQRASSFINDIVDSDCPSVSYLNGVKSSSLSSYLPLFICNHLKEGLEKFDKKIPGFISEGVLLGAETRTSSPIRILRNEERESVSLANFYPVGEGAGYAGGIVSSAVDGINSVDFISDKIGS